MTVTSTHFYVPYYVPYSIYVGLVAYVRSTKLEIRNVCMYKHVQRMENQCTYPYLKKHISLAIHSLSIHVRSFYKPACVALWKRRSVYLLICLYFLRTQGTREIWRNSSERPAPIFGDTRSCSERRYFTTTSCVCVVPLISCLV